MSLATRLASGAPVPRLALVVAHPDDETLWAAGALLRFPDLTLVHLTDGAPEDMADAHRLGFATREAYAAARTAELDAALAALGASPRRLAYAIPDKRAVQRIGWIADRLTADLIGAAGIAVHAYEGGHPDHDAAALAVRCAAVRLAVPVAEFAGYHGRDGVRVFGRFWPDPARPEQSRPYLPAEQARVDAALARYVTQAGVIGDWRPSAERWRDQPDYDFTRPPPPGRSLYDGFGWAITSRQWRELASTWA